LPVIETSQGDKRERETGRKERGSELGRKRERERC
jgi:hypothetical protein